MKKIATICLAIVMMASIGLTAFAANGGFVQSPSLNPAPEIVSYSVEDEGCNAELKIVPYSQRNTLDAADKTDLETVYGMIKNALNASELNADLEALIQKSGIDASDVAVSDLFDMSYVGCAHEEHANHGYFTVNLKADSFNSFVGLLHYNADGQLELVKDVTVKDGVLTAKINDFSPFAVVVNTKAQTPPTGDSSNLYIFIALMVASALAMVVCFAKLRKVSK